jgi:hypothetical protein
VRQVHLFVEILNRYLFYFEAGNEKITTKYIQVDLAARARTYTHAHTHTHTYTHA